MPDILAIILGIFRNQFKCIYLKSQTLFVDILLHFQNLHKILTILKKSLSLIASVFFNYSLRKTWILKGVAGFVSEHPLILNVLKGLKYCRTLQKRIFILRFHHSDLDRVEKRHLSSDLKS